MISKKLAVLKKCVVGLILLIELEMGGKAKDKENKQNISLYHYIPLTKSITYPFHLYMHLLERTGTALFCRVLVMFRYSNIAGTVRSPHRYYAAGNRSKNLFRHVPVAPEQPFFSVAVVYRSIYLVCSSCSGVSTPTPAQRMFSNKIEATK
ncbi:MAG: hypothetical protein JKY52_19875 [Flavobacteriales bacterium]|nr:hypothetical protein [Flavobacteriales bacterium]